MKRARTSGRAAGSPGAFRLRLAALALGALASTGCTTLRYLAQAGCGQVDLGIRARDIDTAIADPATPTHVRSLLAEVPSIKRFAVRQGLSPTKNYARYSALPRTSVVYVVSASDPLAFKARTWTFPIVGSVPYLGWFERAEAKQFAAELRSEGLDVDLRGADAYSTLGWFKDPILSTMLSPGDDGLGDLADVVIHESVHASLYINGQTPLNESIANFLARKLAPVYIDEKLGPDSPEKTAYLEEGERQTRRKEVLHGAYTKLRALYASGLSNAEKLEEKRRFLSRLREEIGFKRPINNATLLGFETYHSGASELEALYGACGRNAARLLATLRDLDAKAFNVPHQRDFASVLGPLARNGCPVRAAAIAATPREGGGRARR